MAAIDYKVTQGDIGKTMRGVCTARGIPVPLPTVTRVLFTMTQAGCADPIIDEATAVPDPDQTANEGEVSYTFVAGDTDEPGDFTGFFTAEWGTPATTRLTFPTEPLRIRIKRRSA